MKPIPRIHLLPCLLLLFLFTSCNNDLLNPNHALAEFNRGNQTYFNFDFEGAQLFYENALELEPHLAPARNNLACALFRQEQFEEAIDAFDAVISDYPKYAKAIYNRGLVKSYQDDLVSSNEDLDRAIALFTNKLDSAKGNCKNGNQYCKTLEKVRDSLNASKEERYEANESECYYWKKVGRLNTPSTDSLLFRTLWLEHVLAYSHYKRGLFRQKLNSYKGAISDYNETQDLNLGLRDSLKTGELFLNRGNCHQFLAKRSQGKANDYYQNAIEDYATAIENPEDTSINVEARYQQGVCYLGLSNWDGALENFRGVIKLQPADARPYAGMGNFFQAQGQPDSAIAYYTYALDLNPMLPGAFFNRGNCFSYLGEDELAIADYSACIELAPDYSNAWFLRGNTRIKLLDVEGGIDDLNIAGEKGHPEAIKELVKWRKKLKEIDKGTEVP